MRRICIGLAASMVLALHLAAQVAVDLNLEQDQFLPGEVILVTVRVSNQSGQKLVLGKNEDWLSFAIESKDGFPVPRNGKLSLDREITVESAQIARVRVDLSPYFELTKLGNYTVSATANIAKWNQQVSSRAVPFNVIRGTALWEQEFGVPPSPLATNANAHPEMRKYALLQANYLKQLQLYVRVTDPSGDRIFCTYPIGMLVSFGQPERQIDRFSNLHVLHQNGARTFNYVVINPDGRLGVRETYLITTTRPALKVDGEGRISVRGGARRISSNDLPIPAVEKGTNELIVPKS